MTSLTGARKPIACENRGYQKRSNTVFSGNGLADAFGGVGTEDERSWATTLRYDEWLRHGGFECAFQAS
jgi:hypothetical protein